MYAHLLLLETLLNGRLSEAGVSIPVSSRAVLKDKLVQRRRQAVHRYQRHTNAQPGVKYLRKGVSRRCFYHQKDDDVHQKEYPKAVF